MTGVPGQGPWGESWEQPGGAYSEPPATGRPPPPRRDSRPPSPSGPRTLSYDLGTVREPVRPRSLDRAVTLMYWGAGLTLVGALAWLMTADMLRDAILEANPRASEAAIENWQNDQMVREIFRATLGVVLWVWMAVKNGDGRRWARGLATAFGIINILATASAFLVVPATVWVEFLPFHAVLALGSSVLAVVILVLLFTESSSRYYDEMTSWHAALLLRR